MELDKILAPFIEEAQLIWKFRWVALLCAWLAAAGGWLVVRTLPDTFEASARVYVNAQTVLKPLLKDLTVSTDTMEQVDLVTRALLTRSHLETVAAATGLDSRARNQNDRDSLVARLQRTIEVTKNSADQVYTISYSDQDPVVAKTVVQALLDDFMADTLRGDIVQSAQAQTFIEDQIKTYEQRLTEAEERRADFKRKNMGLMQGGDSDYYTRFQEAQAAVDALRSQIRSLTNRRNELARQIAGEESGAGDALPQTSVDAAISNLETEAAQLKLRFTDKHPDVVRVNRTLQDLYRAREEELRARAAGGIDPKRAVDPVYQQMKIALSAANADLASLESQLAEKTAQVSYLRSMANTIPDIEAQLARLNRDYDVVKSEYETLLQRLESVKMNQEVQADKKDIQFRVLESPRTPVEPIGPDRFRLNTMVLLGALGFGFAVAFVLSHRDPAFYSANSLREVTGLPVYGQVGIYGAASHDRTLWAFAGATGALLAAYALILVFTGTIG
jgi:polysaccharide chain length determinant protein (PEP-CTERM system associated)